MRGSNFFLQLIFVFAINFLFLETIYSVNPPTGLALTNCPDVPGMVRWRYGTCPGACIISGGERCVPCNTPSIGMSGYACQGLGPTVPNIVSTEIGTLDATPKFLIEAISKILVYLAGGISMYLLLSGAAKYLFSSGNPEAIEEAKGVIGHALGGFLLVFLSVFLLRFLGVDILHIPGFGPGPGGGVIVPNP